MNNSNLFKLVSDFKPAGDQPEAIKKIIAAFSQGKSHKVLEGVTGSGKTFTVANIISKLKFPALVISHNKTLAAQLFSELKNFFPDNAVEYFVSYYDYYQPEAYIPQTDTYIEKDASINEEIEKLRLSATASLMSRKDVVIVSSVSCIYGLGSPEDYKNMFVFLKRGMCIEREEFLKLLVDIQYTRNDIAFTPGTFRVRGDVIEVFPLYNKPPVRVSFCNNIIETLYLIDPLTGKKSRDVEEINIFPTKHFVLPREKIKNATGNILRELDERLEYFISNNKLLEAQRLESRTKYDVDMLAEMGYCSGVENYSSHLTGRSPGSRPSCLIDFFPKDFLTVIDESHVTIPQVRGMYAGDRSRKETLVEFGFRLPSALDNRPLNFNEFESLAKRVLYVSATPGRYEIEKDTDPARQLIRPTGLIDPDIEVRPLESQVDDLAGEIEKYAKKKQRILVTTLTKKNAEDLTLYLSKLGIRVKYIHSDIGAIERVEILRELRAEKFDVLVGINLLREGLDLPEVALVAILDADKEGFLRSEISLIQTSGRVARNINGKVLLYADKITDAVRKTIEVTSKRRKIQQKYNRKHNIKPSSIIRSAQTALASRKKEVEEIVESFVKEGPVSYKTLEEIYILEKAMREAADKLEFEKAAELRDRIFRLKRKSRG